MTTVSVGDYVTVTGWPHQWAHGCVFRVTEADHNRGLFRGAVVVPTGEARMGSESVLAMRNAKIANALYILAAIKAYRKRHESTR